jgi:ABC-type uncharacterized transport system fused permease/ATPase subunit
VFTETNLRWSDNIIMDDQDERKRLSYDNVSVSTPESHEPKRMRPGLLKFYVGDTLLLCG